MSHAHGQRCACPLLVAVRVCHRHVRFRRQAYGALWYQSHPTPSTHTHTPTHPHTHTTPPPPHPPTPHTQEVYTRRYLAYDLMAVGEEYVGRFPYEDEIHWVARPDYMAQAKQFKVGLGQAVCCVCPLQACVCTPLAAHSSPYLVI
jgi:hypothetical protein